MCYFDMIIMWGEIGYSEKLKLESVDWRIKVLWWSFKVEVINKVLIRVLGRWVL